MFNDVYEWLRTLAPAILKTFEIRPIQATFSYLAVLKIVFFYACIKGMTFRP